MSIELLDPVQLRARGFQVLVQSLGWVNAVRFVQQYESSRGNYTVERDQILPSATAADLVRGMNEVLTDKPGKAR